MVVMKRLVPDLAALVAGTIVFSTGLLLITQFHMGDGPLRAEALGVHRLIWLNVHRLAATAFAVVVCVHAWQHWPVVRKRLMAFRATPVSDRVLYIGFALELIAAATAWFVVPGSTPLHGPIELGRLAPARHVFIDLHNFTGLALMPAAFLHIRKRFGWIIRQLSR